MTRRREVPSVERLEVDGSLTSSCSQQTNKNGKTDVSLLVPRGFVQSLFGVNLGKNGICLSGSAGSQIERNPGVFKGLAHGRELRLVATPAANGAGVGWFANLHSAGSGNSGAGFVEVEAGVLPLQV